MTRFTLKIWVLILILTVSKAAQAQAPDPTLARLLVGVWPEYDRAEVLVIYRVDLEPTTPLPLDLTFRLPDYVDSMHAVAVARDGSLFSVDASAVEFQPDGPAKALTFPTNSHSVQFEYYDPVILGKQAQNRQLTFELTAPYATTETSIDVLVPSEAEDFELSPAASDSYNDSRGFTFNTVDFGPLAAGESVNLTASYRRASDRPSLQPSVVVSDQAPDVGQTPSLSLSTRGNTLGYALIGGGALLLLIGGGYWWYTNRTQDDAGPRRRPARRAAARDKRPASPRPARPQQSDAPKRSAPTAFCYQCGVQLRPEAAFCHTCGAKRRT